MARATISRNIDTFTVIGASGQATAPNLTIRDQNFPAGDVAIRNLILRYDATITGTSTPTRVTNGHFFYMNAITVETDKHGKIVDNVDGLLMAIMNLFDFNTLAVTTALSSTPADTDTPACSWLIPFSLYNGIRPYDTNLDMLKSRMKVSTQFGPQTNLWTQAGGTPLVANLVQTIEAKVLPGPLVVGGKDTGQETELPLMIRSFEQIIVPITATQNRFQIALPYGDRIYRRIFVTQRNGSTRAEMTNVIAPTASISLYVNSVPIIDGRIFRAIQAENGLMYGISLPSGVCCLDFDADHQERMNDMLAAVTQESGSMYLYIDVTTQTNGQVWLGLDCLKPIPAAALR